MFLVSDILPIVYRPVYPSFNNRRSVYLSVNENDHIAASFLYDAFPEPRCPNYDRHSSERM